MRLETRRVTLEDAEQLARHVLAGFETYRSFAPAGWEPPSLGGELARIHEHLTDPDTWALLALADGAPAGHVAFFPARERDPDGMPGDWRERRLLPGLAHLWHLFVLPPWWGSGIAASLHDAAIDEMRARGFTSARLYTPSGQLRSRRFYERRGWRLTGEALNSGLRFEVAEYQLTL